MNDYVEPSEELRAQTGRICNYIISLPLTEVQGDTLIDMMAKCLIICKKDSYRDCFEFMESLENDRGMIH